jgi:tRNA dimethylallyltransferase
MSDKTKMIKNKTDIRSSRPKVLVILGTTSAGKTAWGVRLAAELNGEIISADSRQVYRGLDIGTGKDLAEYRLGRKKIPYHLIDVVSPQVRFDLAQYQKLAFRAIADVLQRGKLPIIVGGSGLYLQAVVDNYNLTSTNDISPQRRQWEQLTAEELFKKIRRLKPDFADHLNNSDKNNARRLVRYLEIIQSGDLSAVGRGEALYDFLLLGLDCPNDILRERIVQRLLDQLEKEGLIAEVKRLNDQGVSWGRLISFGLEYKFVSRHLLGELTYQEMTEQLGRAIYQFAKRQKTWFRRWERRGAKINWLKDQKTARKKIAAWLKEST